MVVGAELAILATKWAMLLKVAEQQERKFHVHHSVKPLNEPWVAGAHIVTRRIHKLPSSVCQSMSFLDSVKGVPGAHSHTI